MHTMKKEKQTQLIHWKAACLMEKSFKKFIIQASFSQIIKKRSMNKITSKTVFESHFI